MSGSRLDTPRLMRPVEDFLNRWAWLLITVGVLALAVLG